MVQPEKEERGRRKKKKERGEAIIRLLTLLFLLWPLALDWKPFPLPSLLQQIVKSDSYNRLAKERIKYPLSLVSNKYREMLNM